MKRSRKGSLTHAFVALGLAACQRGFSVAFFTAAGLAILAVARKLRLDV